MTLFHTRSLALSKLFLAAFSGETGWYAFFDAYNAIEQLPDKTTPEKLAAMNVDYLSHFVQFVAAVKNLTEKEVLAKLPSQKQVKKTIKEASEAPTPETPTEPTPTEIK